MQNFKYMNSFSSTKKRIPEYIDLPYQHFHLQEGRGYKSGIAVLVLMLTKRNGREYT